MLELQHSQPALTWYMLSALTSCTGRPTCRAMRSMICSHTIMPCGWKEHRVEAAFKCCAYSAPGNEQRCNAGLGGRAATLLSACRPLSRASSVSNNAFHARDPIPTERHMCLTSLPCSTGSVLTWSLPARSPAARQILGTRCARAGWCGTRCPGPAVQGSGIHSRSA